MKKTLVLVFLMGAVSVPPLGAMIKNKGANQDDGTEMALLANSSRSSKSSSVSRVLNEELEHLRTALKNPSDPETTSHLHLCVISLLHHSLEDLESAIAFVEQHPSFASLLESILHDGELPQEPEAKAQYQWRFIQIYRKTTQLDKEVEIWEQFPPELIETVTTLKVVQVMNLIKRVERERLALAHSLEFEVVEDPESLHTKARRYDQVFSSYFTLYSRYTPEDKRSFLCLYLDCCEDKELPSKNDDDSQASDIEEISPPPAHTISLFFPDLPEESLTSRIDFLEFEKASKLYESLGEYERAAILAVFRLFKLAKGRDQAAQFLKTMYWEDKLGLLSLLIKARQDEAAQKLFDHIFEFENLKIMLDLFDLMIVERQEVLAGKIYTYICGCGDYGVMLDLLNRLVKGGENVEATRNLYDFIYSSGIKEHQDKAFSIYHHKIPSSLLPAAKALKGVKDAVRGTHE